jgi:hypothetical protein
VKTVRRILIFPFIAVAMLLLLFFAVPKTQNSAKAEDIYELPQDTTGIVPYDFLTDGMLETAVFTNGFFETYLELINEWEFYKIYAVTVDDEDESYIIDEELGLDDVLPVGRYHGVLKHSYIIDGDNYEPCDISNMVGILEKDEENGFFVFFVDFEITKLMVPKIFTETNLISYSASENTVKKPFESTTLYTVEVPANSIFSGDYTATVTLNDTENTVWSDGSIAPVSFPYSIKNGNILNLLPRDSVYYNPLSFTAGTVSQALPLKNGWEFYMPELIFAEDTKTITVTHTYTFGDVNLENAAITAIPLEATDTSNAVEFDDVARYVYIIPGLNRFAIDLDIQVAKAVVSTEFTPKYETLKYDGSLLLPVAETPLFSVAVGNNNIVPGTYLATISLKHPENSVWDNGTVTPVIYKYTILKLDGEPSATIISKAGLTTIKTASDAIILKPVKLGGGSFTDDEIAAFEYSKDGENYQSSPVFTKLAQATDYKFTIRYKETNITLASGASDEFIFTTAAAVDGGLKYAFAQTEKFFKTYPWKELFNKNAGRTQKDAAKAELKKASTAITIWTIVFIAAITAVGIIAVVVKRANKYR